MKPIYVVDGVRTPFLKSRNRPGPFAASDLAAAAGKVLLSRQPFEPAALDEVILGCAAPSVDEVNIGRVAALRRRFERREVGRLREGGAAQRRQYGADDELHGLHDIE